MMITAVEPIVLRADRVDTTRADGTQDASSSASTQRMRVDP